ncbi:hypothetical protein [Viridibacillus arvi]|uniref:hypothetical protein n=1 Tax=Viridibacillus arvi TaxID=263475 RepID=UPI0034CE7AEF
MTMTTINLMENKALDQIEKGTIVKKNDDMFIVAKISEAQFSSVVDDALFNPRNVNFHHRINEPREMARRNPEEAKYVLISLTTGMKYYPEFLTLPDLLMRMSKVKGFKLVEKVEIKEVI